MAARSARAFPSLKSGLITMPDGRPGPDEDAPGTGTSSFLARTIQPWTPGSARARPSFARRESDGSKILGRQCFADGRADMQVSRSRMHVRLGSTAGGTYDKTPARLGMPRCRSELRHSAARPEAQTERPAELPVELVQRPSIVRGKQVIDLQHGSRRSQRGPIFGCWRSDAGPAACTSLPAAV